MSVEGPQRSWTGNGLFWSANITMIVGVALSTGGAVILPASTYGGLGDLVQWLPSGALGEAMRSACDGAVAVRDLLVLLAWAVVGSALTARTFQWE